MKSPPSDPETIASRTRAPPSANVGRIIQKARRRPDENADYSAKWKWGANLPQALSLTAQKSLLYASTGANHAM